MTMSKAQIKGCHHSRKLRKTEHRDNKMRPTVIVRNKDPFTVKSVFVVIAYAPMLTVMPAVITAEVSTAV